MEAGPTTTTEPTRRDLRSLVAGLAGLTREEDAEPPDTHLRDYLRTIRKRLGLILGVALLVIAAVAAKTFLERPVYVAAATVLVEREAPRSFNPLEPVPLDYYDPTEFFQTQIRIIRSRPLAQRAAEGLNLRARKPELAEAKDPAQALLGAISVDLLKNTRILEIRAEDPDPALAADIANAVANAYVSQSLETKLTAARDTLAWLTAHVGDLKTKVNESELALQRYKEEAGLASSEEKQSLAAKKLADFNSAYIEAKAKRLELETTLAELRGRREVLESSPLVLNSPLVQRLKGSLIDLEMRRSELLKTYRARHPEVLKVETQIDEVQQKMNEEMARLVRSIEADLNVLKAREAAMLAAVNQYRGEAQVLAKKEIQSGILKREADTNQQLYEVLLKRLKEASLSEGLEINRLRVVESAVVPTRPARPQIARSLLLAVVGGLAAALALAFLIEYLDDTVRTPEQLERALGLPVFALIPRISGGRS
jgi:uncharacterized protein involved in exopolysaccharide biosynthesis